MFDVTAAFVSARARGPWPVRDLLPLVGSDERFAGLRVDWDQGSDEDWLRVLKTSVVLAFVWVPGPLAIVTSGHVDLADAIESATGTTVERVVVPRMDAPVLSLDPERAAEVWPGRTWPSDAVDPTAMSAHELWYATV